MIAFPAGAKVWIAGGVTDMRGGMNSLALKVQQSLGRYPHSHEVFYFQGRNGDLIKVRAEFRRSNRLIEQLEMQLEDLETDIAADRAKAEADIRPLWSTATQSEPISTRRK